MNIEKFIQRTEAFHRRLADLNQTANALPWITSDMLPQAFKELGSNSRMLQLAAEELYLQNEELIRTRGLLEAECQRYQNLFEFAPNAYLLTNIEGIIQEANGLATRLLNVPKHYLIGKPLINFVPLEERRRFRNELSEVFRSDSSRELLVRLQQRDGKSFHSALTIAAVRNEYGKPINLLWVLREIPESEQPQLPNNEFNFSKNRSRYEHCKGETISLNPSQIFYVCQGLVKLSTFCETGEEVLTGLASEKMVFGSSLTSLQTYEATALTEVELVSIDVAEIAQSPALSHALLPKFNQRLRQTESFLAISGRQRVQDRLHYLFRLLKQEIGQSIPEGYRLNVRLTHEELASACCTTRVTITRLMGKLQQEGVISFDSKKHIILQNLS
ncbi:helix-turn-helix domain-containing protein [Plectonema radiosum NIES-515]|uniref:Helix-turn-helix domain-containing protein n=1 Tax=Plectonema radiosum NIES-515 TaxID=2986073 RepID=A0ABT3B1F0_9CYAN|nr:helix-turn-helix domain-containing protein [Plectonema radiosum]MCV3215195.1 helix-turn-helix domain-containing protein [Plectonema radiosum NIES-515]